MTTSQVGGITCCFAIELFHLAIGLDGGDSPQLVGFVDDVLAQALALAPDDKGTVGSGGDDDEGGDDGGSDNGGGSGGSNNSGESRIIDKAAVATEPSIFRLLAQGWYIE